MNYLVSKSMYGNTYYKVLIVYLLFMQKIKLLKIKFMLTNFYMVLTVTMLFCFSSNAQVGIGTTEPNLSAALHISSNDKGVLFPRLKKNEKQSISNPALGLLIYQTDEPKGLYYFNGVEWVLVSKDSDSDSTNEIELPTSPQTGAMNYWNGSEWVIVTPGYSGQVLIYTNGVPTWRTVIGLMLVVEIYNPATGKIWMDRNLGASQVATSSTDEASYGDLYQWGRATDGHEKRRSNTTTTLATSDTPRNPDFITTSSSYYDWRSPKNDNLWQGVNGINNPCPSGYRLPTDAEWQVEIDTWSPQNSDGAFASALKLPLSGFRHSEFGSIDNVGSFGYYWSSTLDGSMSRSVYFSSRNVDFFHVGRSNGFSVRCFKN